MASPLRVLVVGSGAREHALVRACRSSPLLGHLIAAPGNPGMARECPCHPVPVDDINGLVELAREESIHLVIIGPELPLSLGLADVLRHSGVAVYGPGADGALLEASKWRTKELLFKYGIPTAAAARFDDADAALAYLQSASHPIVIKADGLAAGKGVIIALDENESTAAVEAILREGRFGQSGRSLVIEECLQGEETSIHVVVSDREYLLLPTSQDHKRIGEGDTGPNTGGMGAYSPVDWLDEPLLQRIEDTIVRPSVEGIFNDGISFRGTLYIGIMLTRTGPKVLEFNTRFGDPETQVLLPRLESDALAMLYAAATGTLGEYRPVISPDHSFCVVLAAAGYPETPRSGDPIILPSSLPEQTMVFHAGTREAADGLLKTAGGRVLSICSLGKTRAEAARRAYAAATGVSFDGMQYRRDIGARHLPGT